MFKVRSLLQYAESFHSICQAIALLAWAGLMLAVMTKQQLIEQVAGDVGQSRADVERLCEAIFQRMSAALAAGEKVEVRGFGIFEAKETKARTGRNPATGESIEIRASRKATFRASKELKERLTGTRGAEQKA
jgi:DNA-binding protein HU-beta